MSPASKSKSKSKDRPAAKASKEPQKSTKPPASGNAGSGSSASAYNPISGTFHTIETTGITSSPANSNGRFRNIDETDDNSGSSHGTMNEYDTISNNGSSVDLDDLKEKIVNTTLRQEVIPGADNDKREKIRIKNEKKHQRQREKRAQELHERCCGYIMSRKLEVLSQQLVAMGFTSERATLALILNEGKLEESVAWLFEGEEVSQNKYAKAEASGCLKIGITEELAWIEAMGKKYKCSKQDVERAAIASEGDLEKAEEALKIQKRETPITSPKSDEAVESRVLPTQERPMSSVLLQQRRNERDFNYTKAAEGLESVNKNPIPLKSNQLKPPIMEKNSWPVNGSMNLSASYSVAPPIQMAPPPGKMDPRHSLIGHDARTVKPSMVREPVTMMQRPQSINAKSNSISNGMAPYPATSNGWYPNTALNFDNIKMNQNILQNHNMANYLTETATAQRFFNQPGDFKQHQTMINPVEIPPPLQMENSWNPMRNLSSSSSLTPPASLGLFSSQWGSLGNIHNPPSSHLDWNAGGSSMSQCDYTNIDWSLESSLTPSSKINGMWGGVSSLLKNNGGQGIMNRHNSNSVNGVHVTEPVARQQQEAASAASSGGGLLDWTNPFAGQDMFSVPRQFVSSP